MKSYTILNIITVLLASKVYANCFSTKLGYPCCEVTKEIVYVDEDGNWGVENNDWCGIEEETYEPPEQNNNPNPSWDQNNNNPWSQGGGMSWGQQGSNNNPWGQQSGGMPWGQQGNNINPWGQQSGGMSWGQQGNNSNPWGQQSGGMPWGQQGSNNNPWGQQSGGMPWGQQGSNNNPWGQQSGGMPWGQGGGMSWGQQGGNTSNNTPSPVANTVTSGYMSKLNVVDNCPSEIKTKQNGVDYPVAEKISYYSTTTNKNRMMNIILPVDYNENKKYPVLYLLHGILADEDAMLLSEMGTIAITTNLLRQGKAKEMIIVLPNEYVPEGGNEVAPGFTQAHFDGYDNFINELINNIMPYMEKNYSIATGRENTAIAGFSMGGRNSLFIGYKRSDLFGYVGAFSPAPGVIPSDDFSGHHPGLFKEDSEFRSDNPPIVTLISCGTNDSVVSDFPKKYHEILTQNHQENIWFEVPGADHDPVAVTAGLYNFVQTLFGALDD
ncbi:carbohydrate esterase family 1 protein [Piromyces sp. E2]|nr:carbohydrate esterase family 1 protein [Piromyces sp. E2]|eukprot:OUM56962.1 carbohydrate esterase family 1 protein [Piromyces sp. E2]